MNKKPLRNLFIASMALFIITGCGSDTPSTTAQQQDKAKTEVSGQQAADSMDGMSGMTGMGGMSGMTGMTGMTGMDGMSGMTGMTGMDGMGSMTGMVGMSGMSGVEDESGMSDVIVNPTSDYNREKWHPIHFKPTIDRASNKACLTCHQEILDRQVRKTSPAGVKTADTLAWYQTLDTYEGGQETFHRRHLTSTFAQQVMDLKCNTCHQGNDPRDETVGSSADGPGAAVQRKQVDPMICVMCHGKHDAKIMGLPPGDWRESGVMFQYNCLMCHAGIRTNRHQVNFLKADAIEEAGKKNSDVCFGCHGGRAWYRIAYPYPRHNWPGASPTPDWAKDRPTESEARFLVGMEKSNSARNKN